MAESKKGPAKREPAKSEATPNPAAPRVKVRKGALTRHIPADQLEAAAAAGWHRSIPPGRQAPA